MKSSNSSPIKHTNVSISPFTEDSPISKKPKDYQSSSNQKVSRSPLRPETASVSTRRLYGVSDIKKNENQGLRNEVKFNSFMSSLQKTREKSTKIIENNYETIQNLMAPMLPAELKNLARLALQDEIYLDREYFEEQAMKDQVNISNNNQSSPDSIQKKSPAKFFDMNGTDKYYRDQGYLGDKRVSIKGLSEKIHNESKIYLKNVLKDIKHEKKNEKTVIKYLTKVPTADPQFFQKPRYNALDAADVIKESHNNGEMERRDLFKMNMESFKGDNLTIPSALHAIKNLQFDYVNPKSLKFIKRMKQKQKNIQSTIEGISTLKSIVSPMKSKSQVHINSVAKAESNNNEKIEDQLGIPNDTNLNIQRKSHSSSKSARIHLMSTGKKRDIELEQILSGSILKETKNEPDKEQPEGFFTYKSKNKDRDNKSQGKENSDDINDEDILMNKDVSMTRNQIYAHLCSLNNKPSSSPRRYGSDIEGKDNNNGSKGKQTKKNQVNKKKIKKVLLKEELSKREFPRDMIEETAKHLRRDNENRELFVKYGTKLESNVSPIKAQNVAKVTEKAFFNDLINTQTIDDACINKKTTEQSIRNKNHMMKAYNTLQKKCERVTKSNKRMVNIIQKKFGRINRGLKVIGEYDNFEFDKYLLDEFKKDIEKEKQNISLTDLNLKILQQTMKFKKHARSNSQKV